MGFSSTLKRTEAERRKDDKAHKRRERKTAGGNPGGFCLRRAGLQLI